MAPWWLSCGTAALLLLVHVTPVVTQSSCGGAGIHGIPGIPGTHGPNGRDGPKGEKGDVGEAAQPVNGQEGQPGVRGPPGRPGLKGDTGLPGHPGDRGEFGEKGRPFNPSNQQKSFFSCQRTAAQIPQFDTPVDFNRAILPDLDEQLRGEELADGVFTSVIKGIYFFSYHVSAKGRVCLKLVKGVDAQMTMCDISEGYLVSSGSAVLELEAGDSVSLQVTKYNSIVTSQSSTSHTFTGFLISPTA